MRYQLQDDLSALTGEEVFSLVCELTRAETRALEVLTSPAQRDKAQGSVTGLWQDMLDCRLIALAQVARITIPIREASALIARAAAASP
jgi:hypothetical protein